MSVISLIQRGIPTSARDSGDTGFQSHSLRTLLAGVCVCVCNYTCAQKVNVRVWMFSICLCRHPGLCNLHHHHHLMLLLSQMPLITKPCQDSSINHTIHSSLSVLCVLVKPSVLSRLPDSMLIWSLLVFWGNTRYTEERASLEMVCTWFNYHSTHITDRIISPSAYVVPKRNNTSSTLFCILLTKSHSWRRLIC